MSTWTAPSGRQDAGRILQREPLAFTVLLNWNGWKDTVECLSSLQKLEYGNNRVLVVDNGSTNDSVARILAQFPQVEIIEMGKNLGFAGGCNAGIRAAIDRGAEYVWLLNNDTTVDPGALRAMVARAEADPKVGAVGSAIYSAGEPERLQAWGGGYVNFWLGHSRHFLSAVSDEKIQFLTAASLLLRRPALESFGLFDEGFFMYWEDADYCSRLRRAGWRLAVAGGSKVFHKEQGSVGKKSALLDTYFNRSAMRFFEKNAPLPFISIWTGIALRVAKRAMAGDWKRARAVWAGARWAEVAPDGAE
jgi:GT2 family glycosyltransferase